MTKRTMLEEPSDFMDNILKSLENDISRLKDEANKEEEELTHKNLIPKAKTKKDTKSKRRIKNEGYYEETINPYYHLKKIKLPENATTLPSINRKSLIKTIKLLKKPKVNTAKKQKFSQICNYTFLSNKIQGYTWNSPVYLIQHIIKCVLTRNFEALPDLLLQLMNFTYKSYNTITKELTYLMLLLNQEDCGEELNSFYESFFMFSNAKQPKNNFWYCNE